MFGAGVLALLVVACAGSAPAANGGATITAAASEAAAPAVVATEKPSALEAPASATSSSPSPGPTPRPPDLTAVKPHMLAGPLPDALIGTWEAKTTPGQYFVFGPHQQGGYNTLDDVAHGPAGAQGDLLSIERSNGPCPTASGLKSGVIGMYRWVLVTPTELRTYGVSHDPCPRAQFLAAGDLILVLRSTAGLP
jgi:hypothetical protein